MNAFERSSGRGLRGHPAAKRFAPSNQTSVRGAKRLLRPQRPRPLLALVPADRAAFRHVLYKGTGSAKSRCRLRRALRRQLSIAEVDRFQFENGKRCQ
jgi:hypothetical protein